MILATAQNFYIALSIYSPQTMPIWRAFHNCSFKHAVALNHNKTCNYSGHSTWQFIPWSIQLFIYSSISALLGHSVLGRHFSLALSQLFRSYPEINRTNFNQTKNQVAERSLHWSLLHTSTMILSQSKWGVCIQFYPLNIH